MQYEVNKRENQSPMIFFYIIKKAALNNFGEILCGLGFKKKQRWLHFGRDVFYFPNVFYYFSATWHFVGLLEYYY